jgi:hypothetical protein
MQDALSREEYNCVNPAVPVAAMLEAETSDRTDAKQNVSQTESDRKKLSRSAILWIVRHPVPREDRSRAGNESQTKSLRVQRKNDPKARKRFAPGPVSVPRHDIAAVQPAEQKQETLAAQVQSFQERPDLHACLLPGMLSKISPAACEGWQRQATHRTSRLMAKMKLDSCQNCPYRLKSEPAQV